ncbi:MAG: hypothetical protein IIX19_00550, partial [Alistipes sp.]|nr:hypothetical protein [Alistipes sp.]
AVLIVLSSGSPFLDAPHLTASDKKFISRDKGASATFQSKPPMGRTPSTTHRWLFHVKATSATLLTTNLFLVIREVREFREKVSG